MDIVSLSSRICLCRPYNLLVVSSHQRIGLPAAVTGLLIRPSIIDLSEWLITEAECRASDDLKSSGETLTTLDTRSGHDFVDLLEMLD